MTTVTVLMSVYNAAPFVSGAIRSILAQTFTDFELLVIDDGSTDESVEIVGSVRDPRLRLLRNDSNIGLTRSLNIGLAEARGTLIARHDADDLSFPERLQHQVVMFERERDLVLLGAQARTVTERGKPVRAAGWRKCTAPLAIEWQLMFENPFVHSAVMFRRDVIRGCGGYDEEWRTNQDFELWSRVVRSHKVRNLDAELVLLRARPGSISKGYSLDAIRAVGNRLIENRSYTLREQREWDEGLSVFLAASNPGVCAPPRDVEPFIVSVKEMFVRFTELHPQSAESAEIRAHIGSLFHRLATFVAGRAPAAAFRALRAATSVDPRAAWRSAPGIAARVVDGVLRPRRRARGTAVLSIPARDQFA